MKIIETKLAGVLIIEPKVFGDERGWFLESWSKRKFQCNNIEINFVQDNHSYTKEKNTLRGIHFQNNPCAQTKLVRCISGEVLDVVIDLRRNSKTYKEWISVELSSKNKKQLLIPKGFGHAFLTLTNDVEFAYKVDEFYNAETDRSIKYNDPELNIDWGTYNPILSKKDSNSPTLDYSDCNFNMEENK